MDTVRSLKCRQNNMSLSVERKLKQFKNCSILRNHKIMKEDLWVRDGKIVNPEEIFFVEKAKADEQIDCKGAIISAGFIDLQINGGFGIDFSYNTDDVEAGLRKVAKGVLAHGVTAFCPTVVTSPPWVYLKQVLPLLKKQPGGSAGATILGAHVEGPFINKEKKGAHPAEYIQIINEGFKTVLDVYGSIENIRIITLAPELKHAPETIKELTKQGVTVSLGHSVATLQDAEVAVQHGATFITHLFNAMPPFHHRDPGLVGLLASDVMDKGYNIYFGIIADGIHTHPAALRIAYHTHPKGLVLVTDAVSALGLEEGMHQLGQMAIEVRAGRAMLAGTNTLCGSIATMNQCVQLFLKATSCSAVVALEAATLHPAQAIGIESSKGTLNYGADADFVLLGDDLKVWSTWIAGECVHQDSECPSITIFNKYNNERI